MKKKKEKLEVIVFSLICRFITILLLEKIRIENGNI